MIVSLVKWTERARCQWKTKFRRGPDWVRCPKFQFLSDPFPDKRGLAAPYRGETFSIIIASEIGRWRRTIDHRIECILIFKVDTVIIWIREEKDWISTAISCNDENNVQNEMVFWLKRAINIQNTEEMDRCEVKWRNVDKYLKIIWCERVVL